MIDARLSPHVSDNTRHLPVLQQCAALCYRVVQGQPEVLLITTRKSRRWIIPKGWLIDGLTASQAARQEAWEEAGIRGDCEPQAMGQFRYRKRHQKKGPVLCVVDVFPLLVTSVAARFPEIKQRQRKWFAPEKAAFLVNFPELALMFQKLEPIGCQDASGRA
ncbi:NUDIX domain protein [Ruegeria denitrificans]|uniref:NUDIX domain protein n=1 Tax=Ruegeria denitrificans TaxID=1715692 RepID=A0A0P1ICF8_9RHOB|nr:NUDIX domain protein [Ruegeria denitrificans]